MELPLVITKVILTYSGLPKDKKDQMVNTYRTVGFRGRTRDAHTCLPSIMASE